jgi:hypothetical protein
LRIYFNKPSRCEYGLKIGKMFVDASFVLLIEILLKPRVCLLGPPHCC